ncbi:acetylxylan esterase [Pleomorphovibrio marinus]|uniref:acetylxylan esterase n=1 Tax=Pleomorphovibrio marinus TaxID=2164132 RepID=UPI002936D7D5|nr:acetylxylan esterase [Pleomorphovibrio marinus]
MMQNKSTILMLLLALLAGPLFSQSQTGDLIRIMVSPSKEGMVYGVNEDIQFDVGIYQYGQLVKNAEINFEYGPEMMEPTKKGTMTLKDGTGQIKAGKMTDPGFIRCKITFKNEKGSYSNTGTAGVDPEKIQPTIPYPDDFMDFWKGAIKDMENLPLTPTLTLMPEKGNHHSDVYHVSFRNANGYIYGILTKPKKAGKYPALLVVPGAGVRPYQAAHTEKNLITLQIGIHGVPVNQYDSPLYSHLASGPLSGYNTINMDDRNRYYYKRVYLGCVRAVDFLHSLEEFDGENLGVMGGSQGGALSIITAGLDSRVKYLMSYYPALSDLTGYLHGRAGGWPHLFKEEFTNQASKIETAAYYDVVNFAKQVKVPGLYSLGFNDNVCPPTSMYSAINSISADKSISLYKDAAHWTYPEQREEGNEWMFKKLGVK